MLGKPDRGGFRRTLNRITVVSPSGAIYPPIGPKLGNCREHWSRASQHEACLAEYDAILRGLKDRHIEVYWPLDDEWYRGKVVMVEEVAGQLGEKVEDKRDGDVRRGE